MRRLMAALLYLSESIVVKVNRQIVIEVVGGAVLFEDVEEGSARFCVFDEANLGKDGDDAGNGDVDETLARLFELREGRVEHSHELKDALFATCVG